MGSEYGVRAAGGGVVHPRVVGTYFIVDGPTDHGYGGVNVTAFKLFTEGALVWSTFVVSN